MRKRVIVIVSGTALLIAVAVGVAAVLRNRRQPLPPQDVPVAASPAEVRVKAVGKGGGAAYLRKARGSGEAPKSRHSASICPGS